MPRKMKAKLPPLELHSDETIGQRIARFRKAQGFTQQQLADRIGIARTLVTDYETGRLRLNDEMIIRVSFALSVSADVLLGLSQSQGTQTVPDLKVTKRLKEIESLPARQKKSLLLTIDNYLKANQKAKEESGD
jgi:transcriptional regulator with XRE-family HTH domain